MVLGISSDYSRIEFADSGKFPGLKLSGAYHGSCKLFFRVLNHSTKSQTGFFQYSHRRDVLRHHQANDSFEPQLGESETDRSARGFSCQTEASISPHQTIGDADLVELFEIFQAGKADLFTAALDRKSTRLNSSHGYISYAV